MASQQNTLKNLAGRLPPSQLWPWTLIIALAWSLTAAVFYAARAEAYFSPGRLRVWFILFPLSFAALTFLTQKFLRPRLSELTRRELIALLLVSLCLAAIVQLHRPAPLPALSQNHKLSIEVLGEKNDLSTSPGIEITKARALDGSRLPLGEFERTGDWEITENDTLISGGARGASLTYEGPLAGGISLTLRHNSLSGRIQVGWDGVSQNVDLYSFDDFTFNQVYYGSIWGDGSIFATLVAGSVLAAYFGGLLALFFTLSLLIRLKMGGKWAERIIYAAVFLLIIYLFIEIKFSYSEFDRERVFPDTYSYVRASENAITSSSFWIGGRSFSLPLFYKLIGINTRNYTSSGAMAWVRVVQTWFSIFSWTVLALVFSSLFKQRWLRPVAFGLVLFFSVGGEISLWDGLLISESLSFSLFALLAACWFILLRLDSHKKTGILGWLAFLAAAAVTVLYGFVRDSNLYFALAGVVMLAASWLPLRKPARLPILSLATLGFTVALVVFHIFSVGDGGRWQVHVLDNLAARILKDADARQFFTEAGLPISSNLEKVTGMVGGEEWQPYVNNNFALRPVKVWIETKGMQTYLKYLAAHPWQTLWTPVAHAKNLLNGSNLEYRALRFSALPADDMSARITRLYYPHNPWILWGAALVCLAGYLVFGWKNRPRQAEWWIILSFILALYPLMLLLWHVNPLEIERHAAQLGIQLRLGGGMAALLLLDRGLSAPALSRWIKQV